MPLKNKIHNTQKAGDFRLKRAPEVGRRGGLPGRIFMGKKGTNIQKNAPPDHGSFYSCPAYRTSARINCYENGNLKTAIYPCFA